MLGGSSSRWAPNARSLPAARRSSTEAFVSYSVFQNLPRILASAGMPHNSAMQGHRGFRAGTLGGSCPPLEGHGKQHLASTPRATLLMQGHGQSACPPEANPEAPCCRLRIARCQYLLLCVPSAKVWSYQSRYPPKPDGSTSGGWGSDAPPHPHFSWPSMQPPVFAAC